MNRREKLLLGILGKEPDLQKTRMLDATIKIILADMGKQYCKFWDAEGPGIMCFQPNLERHMFFMTLEEIHAAKESCEAENNEDLAETFRRILMAAQKIDPTEKAGYVINDDEGIRYFEICYNTVSNESVDDVVG
jgi:hypothetical protein|tara:strand:+ start:3360 stop:3764 length:405 start_codon:yes stop_codon:yes gene_type:complete